MHESLRTLHTGLDVVSATKRMAMASATRALKEVRIEAVSGFKTDRFLADADWDLVEQHIVIKDPYNTTDDEVLQHKLL